MRLNIQNLARSSSRHPWRVLIIWGLVLVAAGAATSALMADAITNNFDFTNNPEAKRANDLVEKKLTGVLPDTEFVIVSSDRYTAQDTEFQQYAGELAGKLQDLGSKVVASVTNPLDAAAAAAAGGEDPSAGPAGGMSFVSEDGHHVLVPVVITGDPENAVDKAPKLQDVIHGNESPDFHVLVYGQGTAFADQKALADEDLQKGEMFGLLVAMVVLVVVFAAVVAAAVPIIMGIFAIIGAIGLMSLLGIWFDFSFFTPNMISMMGLAVGIDYSLFIVSRFREERRHGLAKLDALSVTGGTANRAVFFSGMTVALALLGMMIMPTTIFRGLAMGAMLVVGVSVAASLTLLPALLALLGDRINWPRLSKRARVDQGDFRGGFWDKTTRVVMGHPVVSLVLATALLLGLASPYFSLKTGMSGVENLPNELETKQAFLLISKYFAGGLDQPTDIVIQGDVASPEIQAAIKSLGDEIAKDSAFGQVSPMIPGKSGDIALVNVSMAGDAQSPASVDAIGRLRSEYVPKAFEGTNGEVLVGGWTAYLKDFFDTTDHYTPMIFVFVLGLSFILLTIVFRSIVVPAKAILMNLLSVGAAYGLVVAVFQKGAFHGVFAALGFHYVRVEAIDAWLPLFLFSILFGLSMDYHVFLLSRIREEYDRTGDNGESVAHGLRTTGSIITGAALIMVAVFISFSHGRLVMLQEMGFGLAAAVFLDATVVRSVLVPSAMKLLGDRNWYLPKWLQWIPKVDIDGREAHQNGNGEEPGQPELVTAGTDGN